MSRSIHHWSTRILQRIFPLPPNYEQDGLNRDELQKEFRYTTLVQTISFLLLWAILTTGLQYLLNHFINLKSAEYDPAIYKFLPRWKSVLGASALCSLPIAVVLQLLIDRVVYRSRYERYTRFLNLRQGYDSQKIIIPLLVPYIGFCIFSLVILNWQVAFRENDIVFSSTIGFSSETKLYSSVDDIYTSSKFRAPAGNIVEGRHFIIKLDDGNTLSTKHFHKEKNDPRVEQAIKYASMKSGKPIRELPVLE